MAEWGWPPKKRPSLPFSPTMYEHMLVCPLSACFRASGYPQRPSLASVIGNVVHAGQEILAAEADTFSPQGTEAEFRQTAARVFDSLLEEEKHRAESSVRPLEIAWDTNRIKDARSAFILGSTTFLESARSRVADTEHRRERTITSADGLVIGTPDLVISDGSQTTIVDLKTGTLVDHDSAQRHMRQLHIYAYIWYSLYGNWPTSGILSNPTTRRQYSIPIDVEQARGIVEDGRAAVEAIKAESDPRRLARPGKPCRRCDYRPWCEPYWRDQESDRDATGAVVDLAVTPDPHSSATNGWITIRGSDQEETLVVRRGPHSLMDIEPGDTIRVIDPYMPPHSVTRVISGFTEVFVAGGESINHASVFRPP